LAKAADRLRRPIDHLVKLSSTDPHGGDAEAPNEII
jgi:hypothetical protein